MTEDFLALGLVTIRGEQHEASRYIDSVSAKGTSAQGKGKADALMKSSALQLRISAAVICSDCILSGFVIIRGFFRRIAFRGRDTDVQCSKYSVYIGCSCLAQVTCSYAIVLEGGSF